MKSSTLLTFTFFTLSLSLAAQEPVPGPPGAKALPVHEGYPVLKASGVLKTKVLKGRHHKVLEAVPTQGFANQYTVKTDWGTFTVHGNHLLMKRIHEFDAIAKLEEVSKSDEFDRALRSAAAKPIHALGRTLQDPVGAVEGVVSGAGRFLSRVGETVERRGKKSANTDSTLKSLIGYSKVKRQIADQLKIDPYSDNPILQRRLDDVARASFAGGFIVKAGMMAISGGAGQALSAVNMSDDLSKMVRDNDPIALSAMNRKKLLGLGVDAAGARAFVEHRTITPSQQTGIVGQLARLGRVRGNAEFLRMTLETKDAADAAFFLRTAQMMAVYHEKVSPVKEIRNLHGLPAIIAKNGSLVVPLSVDYVSWSSVADRLSQSIKEYKPNGEISQRLLYVSGIVSPRARTELEARGFVVSDRASIAVYR